MEVLFVRELVKHSGTRPIITLVNPGLCHTDFMRNVTSPVKRTLLPLLMTLARTAEVGSRTLVAGACATVENHGKYMADGVNQEVAAWVRSSRGVEVQKKVYDQTLAVLEGIEPGITKNITNDVVS
jgi:retinol dehydrogenase-12